MFTCFEECVLHEDATWATLLSRKHHETDFRVCTKQAETKCNNFRTAQCPKKIEKMIYNIKKFWKKRSPTRVALYNMVIRWGEAMNYSEKDKPAMLHATGPADPCPTMLRLVPGENIDRHLEVELPTNKKEIVSLVLPWAKRQELALPKRFHQKLSATKGQDAASYAVDAAQWAAQVDNVLDQPMSTVEGNSRQVAHYVVDMRAGNDAWLQKLSA